MARVLINHGWTNTRQEGHWQRWLFGELRTSGHQVQYPQYPQTQNPVFGDWQDLLRAELELLSETGTGEKVVIAHSLGCVNVLQAAVRGLITTKIDRLLLVAPADPETLDELPDFQLDVANCREALSKIVGKLTLVASDKDPWLPKGIEATYGQPLGVTPHVINGAGHLTAVDGFGPWFGVRDWVTNPSADLNLH